MSNAQLADNLGVAEFEVGSAEHRRGPARFFLGTHIDYEPEKLRWPTLGEAERIRLISRVHRKLHLRHGDGSGAARA